ncbi:MAG TPA: hypothetical protein VE685_14595 [Thermoanaerobaculia bacterium]|nr:hypothetical protein [Thermoanaerobaculia bacterium]
MDDSERSYGYSEDIYHGPKRDEERSYEYGPEGGMEDNVELSPEEAAVHVVDTDRAGDEPVPDPEAGHYDYGREGEYATTESFTWDLETSPEREAGEERSGEREEATAAKTVE